MELLCWAGPHSALPSRASWALDPPRSHFSPPARPSRWLGYPPRADLGRVGLGLFRWVGLLLLCWAGLLLFRWASLLLLCFRTSSDWCRLLASLGAILLPPSDLLPVIYLYPYPTRTNLRCPPSPRGPLSAAAVPPSPPGLDPAAPHLLQHLPRSPPPRRTASA
uniref:Uncharacterized protein n=1 Tax=Ananas comosus var. bracteatus TaxID=296719 RepID=A0A6V7PVD1_ANACO|nr:unnamed protein product [Ananas comosus var. bracteatus]